MAEGSVQTIKLLITGGLGNLEPNMPRAFWLTHNLDPAIVLLFPSLQVLKKSTNQKYLPLPKLLTKTSLTGRMANSKWKVTSNTSAPDFPRSDNLSEMFSGTFQKGIFVGGGPGTENKSVYCYMNEIWNLINARQR